MPSRSIFKKEIAFGAITITTLAWGLVTTIQQWLLLLL